MVKLLGLPRPHPSSVDSRAAASQDAIPTVPAPAETAFVRAFGQLLPPARFVPTPYGHVASYLIPSDTSTNPAADGSTEPVVLIHGVQTPAIGLLPLASELHRRYPNRPVLLFDLYGHGLTGTPLIALTPDIFHTALDALLAHNGWASAHFIGYSFGGSILAGYTSRSPRKVRSAALIAPAGLIELGSFTAEEQALIAPKAKGQAAAPAAAADEEAAARAARDFVFTWLEGGDLVVPADTAERIGRGEVVAEAVKAWELEQHDGYAASVVSIVRDGGVLDNHASFRTMVKTGVRNVVILGEKDGVCDRDRCLAVGLDSVHVVPGADHGLVRNRVGDVADLIDEFWTS